MKEEKTKKLKCERCSYSWTTISKMVKVNCPSCGKKVKNREIGVRKNE